MIRRFFAAVLAVALCSGALADFRPTAQPVSPDGMKAIVDLPASQHMRNIGGSDGAGLCVFTSLEHGARWQCVNQLDGFQRWMSRRPGGGWPEKVDDMIASYAREQGVTLPSYIQHTGGDAAFLELALHTDRVPCVTYAGRDDFYRGRIAHMVNLAHLDSQRAAIIDNNRPGVWVWMTRAEFLQRWRDMQGGWAVVLLNAPPPPHPATSPKVEGLCTGCVCGESCKCKAGECPNKCPVANQKFKVEQLRWGQGGCSNGRCYPTQPSVPAADDVYRNFYASVGRDGRGYLFVGVPARYMYDAPTCAVPSGFRGLADGEYDCFLKDGEQFIQSHAVAAPAVGAASDNFGVDCSRIHTHPTYSINGVAVSREDAHAALSGGSPLADDSDRWHLTAVGDAAFLAKFKADVAALPADVRGKLLVQAYGPERWEVSTFSLPVGVNLRKPSPERTAADVGSVPASEYTSAKLSALLAAKDGPAPAPDPPKPAPVDPSKPAPVPVPAPELPLWAIGLAALLYFLLRKR